MGGVKGKLGVRTHGKCFRGQDAVRWMISTGTVDDEEEALLLGNAMLAYGIFSERAHEHAFRNKPYLYRFALDEFDRLAQTRGHNVKVATTDYKFLCQAAERMRGELRDRTLHMDGCFPGAMCVGWLKQAGLADTESEAVAMGNALMRVGLICHVSRRKVFEPTKELYRFSLDAFEQLLSRRKLALSIRAGSTSRHRSSVKEKIKGAGGGSLAHEGGPWTPDVASLDELAVGQSRREALARFLSTSYRHFHLEDDDDEDDAASTIEADQDPMNCKGDEQEDEEEEGDEKVSVNDLYKTGSSFGFSNDDDTPTEYGSWPSTPIGGFIGASCGTPQAQTVLVSSELFTVLQSLATMFPHPPAHDPDLMGPPPPELAKPRWPGHARRQTMKV